MAPAVRSLYPVYIPATARPAWYFQAPRPDRLAVGKTKIGPTPQRPHEHLIERRSRSVMSPVPVCRAGSGTEATIGIVILTIWPAGASQGADGNDGLELEDVGGTGRPSIHGVTILRS